MGEKAGTVCSEPRFQFSDWILSCALRHTDGYQLRERHGERQYYSAQFFTALEYECCIASKTESSDRKIQEAHEAPVNKNLLQSLQEKSSFSINGRY